MVDFQNLFELNDCDNDNDNMSLFDEFTDLKSDEFVEEPTSSEGIVESIDDALDAHVSEHDFDSDPLDIDTDLVEEATIITKIDMEQNGNQSPIQVSSLEEMMEKLNESMRRTDRTRDILFNTIGPTFLKSRVHSRKPTTVKSSSGKTFRRRVNKMIIKRRLSSFLRKEVSNEAFFDQRLDGEEQLASEGGRSVSEFLRRTKRW
eukprot:scaffold1514_cov118-Cylindrotheca_fusiformis.AAC.8